jgi:hypothetical protein
MLWEAPCKINKGQAVLAGIYPLLWFIYTFFRGRKVFIRQKKNFFGFYSKKFKSQLPACQPEAWLRAIIREGLSA